MESSVLRDLDQLCMGCMRVQATPGPCSLCGFDELAPIDLPIALYPRTVLANQYLVGRVLGHGGFGITYLGWDLNLNIKLAIKEYFPNHLVTRDGDKSTVSALGTKARESFAVGLDRFLAEARILARFHEHPGVVSVLSFFRAHGTGYLVMNYIEGITLKTYLEREGGRISHDLACKILMPVMDALKEVHGEGVLHRDISPDNIYITDGGIVKLLDFGAAREALEGSEKSFSVVLKQGYAPPEQYISRGEQGPWTDVYALGATLFRCLYGVSPPESLARLTNDTFQIPDNGEAIPDSLAAAIRKALAPNHLERFPAVADLQRAIVSGSTFEVEQRRSDIKPQFSQKPNRFRALWIGVLAVVGAFAIFKFSSSSGFDTTLRGDYSFDDGQLQFDGVHRVSVDSDGKLSLLVEERAVGSFETDGTGWKFEGQRGEKWRGTIAFKNSSEMELAFADLSNGLARSWALSAPEGPPRRVPSLIGRWKQSHSALGFEGERVLVVEPSGATRFEGTVSGEGRLAAEAGKWTLLNKEAGVIDTGSFEQSPTGEVRFVGKKATFRLVRTGKSG